MEAPIKEFKASAIEGTDEIRRCTICNEVQSTNEFYRRPNGSILSHCRGCHVGLATVRQSVNRYKDIERAIQYAESYTGGLRDRAFAYISKHQEGGAQDD